MKSVKGNGVHSILHPSPWPAQGGTLGCNKGCARGGWGLMKRRHKGDTVKNLGGGGGEVGKGPTCPGGVQGGRGRRLTLKLGNPFRGE